MNEKQVIKLTNSNVQNMNIRKLNNAGENFLTESGVYKLIFKSHKEEAEKFQDWVTDEVLPQIRKTGGYIPVTDEMSDMEILSRAMIISQKTINNQKRIINKQQRRIVSLEEDIETLNNKLLLSQGQVNMIVSALKQRYFDLHGKIGWACDEKFIRMKKSILRRFNVSKYSDIKQYELGNVFNYIKTLK